MPANLKVWYQTFDPLTGNDLKTNPQTIAAKLGNRKVSEDADWIPVVGPFIKKVADFFEVNYDDVGSAAKGAAPYYCPSPNGCMGVQYDPGPNK